MKKIIKLLALPVLICGLFNTANAATPGAYIGAGGGYAKLEDFSDASNTSNNGFAGRVFAGYNFNRYIGLETSYAHFSDTTYEFNDYDYSYFSVDYKYNTVGVVGKVYMPLQDNEDINLYLSVGALLALTKADIKFTPYDETIDSSENNSVVGTVGVGAAIRVNKNVSFMLDYLYGGSKDGSDDEIGIPNSNLATVNIVLNFV